MYSDRLIDRVREMPFPKIADPRGNLTFMEGGVQVPFAIRRVYYLYDIPGDEESAGNASLCSDRIFIPLSGSLDLTVTDGVEERNHRLRRADRGVFVPAGLWVRPRDYTSGTLVVVLCSGPYEEEDVISDFDNYLNKKI